MRWLLALVGVVLGGAVGLLGPVFLGNGSGSYEALLPFWLLTLPLGVFGGAFLGFFLGGRTR